MTITKRWLRKMAESMRIWIPKEKERIILGRFSAEPYPYEWSEQDIFVQIQNFLGCGEFEREVCSAYSKESEILLDREIF